MRSFPLVASCAAMLFSGAVYSQENVSAYPSKAVTFVLPADAGTPTDIETRVYAKKLNGAWGQPVLIENRPGASQTIGAAYVAKAKPDGYTMLGTAGSFTAYPALLKDLSFDTLKDFAAVSLMSQNPLLLVTYPSFPSRNLVEYLTYARANPGKVSFGTFGSGSITHLAGEWIHTSTNTKVTYIGYKNSTTQLNDVMAGRLDAFLIGMVAALPQMKAGKMRALAISTTFRSKLTPDVATAAEQGVPGFNVSLWTGYLAPAATPAPIVNKVSAELAKIAKEADVIQLAADNGGITVGSTAAEFKQFVVTETERWRKLVQDNGIKME